MKTFYVCSYGGCGSKMLCDALKIYGNVEHIHSRNPPLHLEYIGKKCGGNAYYEWFNGIKIPDEKINEYYVIYLYKNPVKSILSRFFIKDHLKNIETDQEIKIADVVNTKKDLYGITEFYNNYTQPNENRNYKIYCIKYEDLFDRQDDISNYFEIGKLNLIKKETNRLKNESDISLFNELHNIYNDLINKMNKNEYLFVV